jgi:hypothetical protein
VFQSSRLSLDDSLRFLYSLQYGSVSRCLISLHISAKDICEDLFLHSSKVLVDDQLSGLYRRQSVIVRREEKKNLDVSLLSCFDTVESDILLSSCFVCVQHTMNNSMENGEDPFADIWISNWERQCEIELENEPDLEGQVHSERDLSTQKLWYLFQNSATSVAQLFKGIQSNGFVNFLVNVYRKPPIFLILDRNQPQVLWLPFQNAAGTITSLYKGERIFVNNL